MKLGIDGHIVACVVKKIGMSTVWEIKDGANGLSPGCIKYLNAVMGQIPNRAAVREACNAFLMRNTLYLQGVTF